MCDCAEHFRSPHCLLSLEILLPHKEEFTPPLNVRVVDNRKFGRRPIIGQHSITLLTPFLQAVPRPEAVEWRKRIAERRKEQSDRIAAARAASTVVQVTHEPEGWRVCCGVPVAVCCVTCKVCGAGYLLFIFTTSACRPGKEKERQGGAEGAGVPGVAGPQDGGRAHGPRAARRHDRLVEQVLCLARRGQAGDGSYYLLFLAA